MKIEKIKTEICVRKVYVPPMASFEVMDKGCILAGSIPGKGQDTETGGSGDEDPVMPQSFFLDPVSIEDNYLDADNYR